MPADETKLSDSDAARITRVEELAYELTIDEVMTKKLITLTPELTIRDALDVFRKHRISGAPVAINGELIGIISIEDLIRSLRDGRIDLTVADYMTRNVVTAHNTDPLIEALKLFVKFQVGRLPILDENGKLAGILTKGDITDGLLSALQRDYEAEELIRYRASHLFEDIISDHTTLILRYNVKKNDFLHGGAASNNIKKALRRLRCNPANCPPMWNCRLRSRNGTLLFTPIMVGFSGLKLSRIKSRWKPTTMAPVFQMLNSPCSQAIPPPAKKFGKKALAQVWG